MSRTVKALALCWLALVTASPALADGKLDRTRDEIRNGSGGDEDRDSDEGEDDGGGGWIGDLVEGFVHALFTIGDDDDDSNASDESPEPEPPPLHPEFGYRSYPYQRDGAAYIVEIDRALAYVPVSAHSDVELAVLPAPVQPLAGQIALEGGHWDGLTRSGVAARLLTDTRFELDGRGLWLHEPASEAPDALLGDAHVAFRFAQSDALLLRMGLGVRFWSDRELEDIGLDALLGLDLFPVRPLVVSAQASAGNLGQAAVGSARIQLGVAFRRFELLAGVEWLWIGDVELSSPLVGMRLWL